MLSESRNLDFKKEALFVLCNAVTGADLKLRADIYDKTEGSIFITMIHSLNINDPRLLNHTLDAIDDLLALDHWYGIEGTSQALIEIF